MKVVLGVVQDALKASDVYVFRDAHSNKEGFGVHKSGLRKMKNVLKYKMFRNYSMGFMRLI